MNALEMQLKRIALNAAIDFTLRGIQAAPARCARNLLEFGTETFPGALDPSQREQLLIRLTQTCRTGDRGAVKAVFFTAFQEEA